jgi:peroxiredoxin
MKFVRGRGGIASVMLLLLSVGIASPAAAQLKVGAKAPDFTTPATLAGHEFTFALADALKKGPVVLYFYPAAFTPGCTVEAHEFAEAVPKFQALGATVIGVSRDKISTLDKFSVTECRSAFPVASDATGNITRSYDAVLSSFLRLADRTSYVIAPDGTILYAYHALDPEHHVGNTLGAVTAWAEMHKVGSRP